MVSALTFYADDPSLNPAEAHSFFCAFEKNQKQKEVGIGPFYKDTV